MASAELKVRDLKTYSVYDLYCAGGRFSDDYDDTDAVEHYLEMHPDADPVAVRAELTIAIAKG